MFIPMKSIMSTRPKLIWPTGVVINTLAIGLVTWLVVMVVVAVWWMWPCSVVFRISKKTCIGKLS